jgi:acyl-CoA synthetase (AMP-forming)/AMP-acid ligase II
MFSRAGENIYPDEVENLLFRHPRHPRTPSLRPYPER